MKLKFKTQVYGPKCGRTSRFFLYILTEVSYRYSDFSNFCQNLSRFCKTDDRVLDFLDVGIKGMDENMVIL